MFHSSGKDGILGQKTGHRKEGRKQTEGEVRQRIDFTVAAAFVHGSWSETLEQGLEMQNYLTLINILVKTSWIWYERKKERSRSTGLVYLLIKKVKLGLLSSYVCLG